MELTSHEFGKSVVISHWLTKAPVYHSVRNGELIIQKRGHIWTPKEYNVPRSGIFLGIRRIRDGYTIYNDYDELNDFETVAIRTAYLVAIGPHRNPVYVLPEHVREANEDSTA